MTKKSNQSPYQFRPTPQIKSALSYSEKVTGYKRNRIIADALSYYAALLKEKEEGQNQITIGLEHFPTVLEVYKKS